MLQETRHFFLFMLPDKLKIQKCDSETFPELKCLFQASKTFTVKK